MSRILIVEDEVDLSDLVATHLRQEGHQVLQAFDGPSGLALVEGQDPHLVILDWMLPGLDGLAVCRQDPRAPPGAGDHAHRPGRGDRPRAGAGGRRGRLRHQTLRHPGAAGAGAGGPAPRRPGHRCYPPRRYSGGGGAGRRGGRRRGGPTGLPAAPAPVDRGPLHVDPAARSATVEGAPLELTRTEFDLLLLLVTHPGRAFSRDFLLERVWGYDYDGAGRTVDSHVMRLRRKLGPLGEQIVTVWGVGYRFVV